MEDKKNEHSQRNGRGEACVSGIDDGESTLCYLLSIERIQLVPVGEGMAAQIHEGERRTNGPVSAGTRADEDRLRAA